MDKHISEIIKCTDGLNSEMFLEAFQNNLRCLGAPMMMLCLAMEYANKGYVRTALFLSTNATKAMKGCYYIEVVDVISKIVESIRDICTPKESMYQKMFEKHIEKIVKGCRIISKKWQRSNQPDGWILLNGEEIPVEIKRGAFDEKALKQLERYMTAFNSQRGIAMGAVLATDIPSNIQFIDIETLEKCDGIDRKEIQMIDEKYLRIYQESFEKAAIYVESDKED